MGLLRALFNRDDCEHEWDELNWNKLYCLLLSGHDRRFVEAKDYEEDGYKEFHHNSGETTPIPACTVIYRCHRCDDEKAVYSPAYVADKFDLPKEWED